MFYNLYSDSYTGGTSRKTSISPPTPSGRGRVKTLFSRRGYWEPWTVRIQKAPAIFLIFLCSCGSFKTIDETSVAGQLDPRTGRSPEGYTAQELVKQKKDRRTEFVVLLSAGIVCLVFAYIVVPESIP